MKRPYALKRCRKEADLPNSYLSGDNRQMRKQIFFIFSVILILSGCWKQESSSLETSLALVNDEAITVEEIKALLPDENRTDLKKDKIEAAELTALRRGLLEQLIERKILLQEARKQKIVLTKTELSEKIDILRDGVDEESFFETLSKQNISREIWEQATRENMLIEKLLYQLAHENNENAFSISEETLRSYYDNNREQWHVGEQLKLRQIVIETEEAAQALRLSILDGADFYETAKIHASQTQFEDGGSIGYVSRNEVPAEFDPLFKAEIGSVSEVIKTPFGYHIVMIEDKKPERILLFDEIKEKLHQALRDRKKERLFSGWIKKLRLQTEIRINEKLLKTFS